MNSRRRPVTAENICMPLPNQATSPSFRAHICAKHQQKSQLLSAKDKTMAAMAPSTSGFVRSRPSLRSATKSAGLARSAKSSVQVAERILRYPGGVERRLSYPVAPSSKEATAVQAADVDGAAEARAWISAWRTRSLEQCLEPVSAEAEDNAAEARAWIEAWRSKPQEPTPAVAEVSSDNAAEARAWIEAWRSKPQEPTPAAAEVSSDNAAEARAWIAKWRSEQSQAPVAKATGLAAADVFGSWLQEEGVITFTAEQLNDVCLKTALDTLRNKC